jgi:hypothetical protein
VGKMTAIGRAIEKAGSCRKLGMMLSPPVSSQAVSQWYGQNYMPVKRAREVEEPLGIPARELVKKDIAEAFGFGAAPNNFI